MFRFALIDAPCRSSAITWEAPVTVNEKPTFPLRRLLCQLALIPTRESVSDVVPGLTVVVVGAVVAVVVVVVVVTGDG